MQERRARSPACRRQGDHALHIARTFYFVIYPEVEHEFSTERDYSSDGDTCDV
jgi:hypothetical protein